MDSDTARLARYSKMVLFWLARARTLRGNERDRAWQNGASLAYQLELRHGNVTGGWATWIDGHGCAAVARVSRLGPQGGVFVRRHYRTRKPGPERRL